MELKKIADLINQGKLKEAKIKLIEIIEERKNLVEKLPSQEKSYENIYYTLSQVCSQLNELEEAKNYLKNICQFFLKIVRHYCYIQIYN